MRERDLRALEFDKVAGILAGFAASEPAREVSARLDPATDPEVVRDRLRATAEMVELRQHAGALAISEFTDLRGLFLAAAREGSVLDGQSLLKIRDFVLGSRHIASFLGARIEPFPHVGALAANLLAPKELADALLKALAEDGGLLDDASPALARLRNRLRAERIELETRLLRSLNLPGMEAFTSDYLVTVRNRRFVLPLKLNFAERLEGIVQDRSVSGETLFVEPMWAVELNNRLMMLESEAEGEERRILALLSAMVRGYATELKLTFDAMVVLDALNARAIYAERFGCSEPEVGEDEIDLREARHPLLLAGGREVVPIDVNIPPAKKGLVISGPNTGGKTVALKTIGLLALMAQAGILIPARGGSRVRVFRSIFTDIGDEQSIEANLSTFSAHIANLSEIVSSLVEPALVILDEPGAGTDPAEGGALAIGLLGHLASRRCVVAVATHSTALKLHAYSRPDFEVAAVDFDAEQLLPLYRLKPHTIGQSYGLAVARRLGLPEKIIGTAESAMGESTVELGRALERLENERSRLAAETGRARERVEELERKEREAVEAAARARERIEGERAKLRAEAKELIARLRGEGEEILRELKSRKQSRRELGAFISEGARRVERLTSESAPSEDQVPEEPLKVGDVVELGGIRGALVSLGPERAIIERGGLRIEVSPERLRRTKAEVPPQAAKRSPQVSFVPGAEQGEELNLVGMRTADALRKLEQFLDQAYLANRQQVRIIHGIGSGALKKAVEEYLSTSPYCASYRDAERHQGGAGATVVELNS